MRDVLDILESVHPVSAGCKQYLEQTLRQRTINRGEYFQVADKIADNIGIITSGLMRSFYLMDDKEYSSWFMREGDLVTSVRSFFSQLPGSEFIEAYEKTTLYYMTYHELQFAYSEYIEFNIIGRKVLEQYYTLEAEKNYVLKLPTVAERYAYLLENDPWMIQRISAKHIASYLGVSEHRLSHIKSGR